MSNTIGDWIIPPLGGPYEADRIIEAENEIRYALSHPPEWNGVLSSTELGYRLNPFCDWSLIRLALQRMIGREEVIYDRERCYSLARNELVS